MLWVLYDEVLCESNPLDVARSATTKKQLNEALAVQTNAYYAGQIIDCD